MPTLHDLRSGLGHAWDQLAEGWRQLYQRAGHALTRFTPSHGTAVQTAEESVARQGSRWGVLAADIAEEGDRLLINLEVPGMEPGDFDIEVGEDYLVVRGEKRIQREETRGRYHVMERAYGRFERAIPLPMPVERDGVKARYDKGVLRISLPKSGRRGGRKIDVQVG